MTPRRRATFTLGETKVAAGSRAALELPVARLPTGTWLSVPVLVSHGRFDGPVVFVSAAIHGDELNGIEVVHRVNALIDPRRLRGTLVTVPVVNAFGLVTESRYLPDRRDLNRSFPGSPRGSLAARIAHMLMTTVVSRCELGIDLHTGSDHRENLPHVRADLSDHETLRFAVAFGAPICLDSRARDGSLRDAATRAGVRVLLYEGGQAHRFDETPIRTGVAGIRRVLSAMDMAPYDDEHPPEPTVLRRSRWSRASRSGIFRPSVELGETVTRRAVLGAISDTFGTRSVDVRAPAAGIVLGINRHPLVHRGDALVHVALTNSEGAGQA